MSEHKVSAYTVYPTGYDQATFADKHMWTLEVTDTGRGWAVRQIGQVLNSDGDWEYEHIPSERTEEFFARCRWPEEEALQRAHAAVDDVVINGGTITQVDAHVKARLAAWEQKNAAAQSKGDQP